MILINNDNYHYLQSIPYPGLDHRGSGPLLVRNPHYNKLYTGNTRLQQILTFHQRKVTEIIFHSFCNIEIYICFRSRSVSTPHRPSLSRWVIQFWSQKKKSNQPPIHLKLAKLIGYKLCVFACWMRIWKSKKANIL